MEFRIISKAGDEIEIVQKIPPDLIKYKLAGAETNMVTGSFGNMLFHHFKGEGFDIWYSNYLIMHTTSIIGRAEIPVLELHIPFENRFDVNWDGIGAANLFEKQFELSYTPFVNTTVEFIGGKHYHTFDIHFSFHFLEPYASHFPLLHDFLQKVIKKQPASLMGLTKLLDPDMITMIKHMIKGDFIPALAGDFYESALKQLLIRLFKRISGIDPDAPEKFSPTDIEKTIEVKRIIIVDLSKNYSITELARKVATNECTLKGCFKQIFGTTIYQYKLAAKMEYARQLLLDTDLLIQDISEMVGYGERSNLSLPFTKHFGYGPGFLRKKR
ncbi:MAG: helix-turn-helix transcriptional regulator [Chitinophagaceae bacterium]